MNNTQNTTANSNRAYNLSGTVSNIERLVDSKGRGYTKCRFDTTVAGKPTSRIAMAFGKAHDALASLTEGEGRLYVRFDGGVFAVIGLGLPPKSEAAAPANDVAPAPEVPTAPVAETVAEKPKRVRKSRAKATEQKLAA